MNKCVGIILMQLSFGGNRARRERGKDGHLAFENAICLLRVEAVSHPTESQHSILCASSKKIKNVRGRALLTTPTISPLIFCIIQFSFMARTHPQSLRRESSGRLRGPVVVLLEYTIEYMPYNPEVGGSKSLW